MHYYIVANWKCHKSTEEGLRWLDRFARLYRPQSEVQIVIAPTMLSLESLAAHLRHLQLPGVSLAAQDVSPFPRGGYTGAIAADMLKGVAEYVLIGHSERRRYFHETVQEITNKVTEAVDNGLVPIVCVEPDSVLNQLLPMGDLDPDQLLLAFTPVDAMNFRIPESPANIALEVSRIRRLYPRWPVIYGGALNVDNLGEYLQLRELGGLFVGSASLDVDSFAAICNKATLARYK